MMVLMWLVFACSSPEPRTPVLLVTVDGLRADHVGSYGHQPTETPVMDGLAGQGTKYLRAYTPSTISGPAQASILSGLSPPSHGLRLSTDSIPSGVGSLPGVLQKQGWSVAMSPASERADASVLAWLSASTGGTVKTDETADFTWFHAGSVNAGAGRSHQRSGDYDDALHAKDAAIGVVINEWRSSHAGGLIVLVGTHGANLADSDGGGLLMTDGWLRVPLILAGPGVGVSMEDVEVVSTVDVAPTIAALVGVPFDAGGLPLFLGGTEFAYSESMSGWDKFRTHPLYSFTEVDGRYVEGVYGVWHPAGVERVRSFEDPESEYPEKAARLKSLRDSFKSVGWSTAEADASTIDLRSVQHSLPVLEKARQSLRKGRVEVAARILRNMDARLKNAPAVMELQAEINSKLSP